jgi:hypothetical protein
VHGVPVVLIEDERAHRGAGQHQRVRESGVAQREQRRRDRAAPERPAPGCPPLPDLVERYQAAGGQFLVCPICFYAKGLDEPS